jgi:hypothetical protein
VIKSTSNRPTESWPKKLRREVKEPQLIVDDESVLSLLNGKRKVEKREITPAEEKNMEMSKYYREMSKRYQLTLISKVYPPI